MLSLTCGDIGDYVDEKREDARPWTGRASGCLLRFWRLCEGELRGRREVYVLAVLHVAHVFDTDAAPARQVDTGLDREDHAVVQHVVGGATDPWRFVNLQADAVTEPMPEVLAVARFFDNAMGDHVRL